MRARLLAFTAIVVALLRAGSAHAQAIQTWGAPAPSSSATTVPQAAPSATEPPAPPPSTIGTPVDEASPPRTTPPPVPRSAPVEAEEPTPPSSIVRSPGHVGLRYVVEGIEVRGNTSTLTRVVLRYILYRPGDTLDVDDKEVELTRYRLLGTGFFRDVNLSLRRGSHRGYVILVVTVVERNTIVLDNVWLGLANDAASNGRANPTVTAYGGIGVAETNLGGTGITVAGAIAVADNQLGLRTRFVDPAFLGSSWTLEARVLYNQAQDYFGNNTALVWDPSLPSTQGVAVSSAILQYTRFGGALGAGHDLGLSTQLFLDYRLEKIDANPPQAASYTRGTEVEPIDFYVISGSSYLSTLRANLVYDTRDTPVLTTSGRLVSALAEASLTPFGSDYPYAKLQLHGTQFARLPWGHVLKLDAFAGAIFGSAPLFEKYFVGDFSDLLPDRVLDLALDRRAAPNYFNTDILYVRYGQYAASLNVEYRVPVYHGTRSIYGVDLFASAGVFGLANEIDLTQPPPGFTGFSKVPVDFTFNLGIRADTALGGFLFGISNFLGFLPVGGASQ